MHVGEANQLYRVPIGDRRGDFREIAAFTSRGDFDFGVARNVQRIVEAQFVRGPLGAHCRTASQADQAHLVLGGRKANRLIRRIQDDAPIVKVTRGGRSRRY